MTTRTYRGRSLEELLPRVRAELGPDAVIVRQREGLTGGVGGFFQKRCVEIEAMSPDGFTEGGVEAAPAGSFSVRDDSPATPDFLAHLSDAQARGATKGSDPFVASDADPFAGDDRLGAFFTQGSGFAPDPPPEPASFEPLELPEVVDDDAWSDWAAESLPPAAAPEVRPVVTDAVPALPRVEHEAPLPVAMSRPPAAPAPAPSWPDEAEPLRDTLVAHGLDAPLADAVLEETVTHVLPFASGRRRLLKPLVASTLARHIPVAPVAAAPGRVIAFVGPGGAGKTHLVGHLAGAYATASGLPVSCLALGPADAGAELALLLSPAGVPMQVATDAASAGAGAAALRERSLVLVDTPGVSPRAKGALRSLHAALRAIGADEVVVAVPATMSAPAARELVAAGRRLGAGALALTHADETDHIGPAIGVAMESGLPFAYIGQTANGKPAVRPAAAEELAKALLTSSGAATRR